jgi:hypothetical protein
LSPEPETGVDFFRHGALPVPVVTIEEAERMAKSFGLTVRAEPLGSQQDSNFLLRHSDDPVGVLKIANPAAGHGEQLDCSPPRRTAIPAVTRQPRRPPSPRRTRPG